MLGKKRHKVYTEIWGINSLIKNKGFKIPQNSPWVWRKETKTPLKIVHLDEYKGHSAEYRAEESRHIWPNGTFIRLKQQGCNNFTWRSNIIRPNLVYIRPNEIQRQLCT